MHVQCVGLPRRGQHKTEKPQAKENCQITTRQTLMIIDFFCESCLMLLIIFKTAKCFETEQMIYKHERISIITDPNNQGDLY